jgi:small-conductance mechanosensitive channel
VITILIIAFLYVHYVLSLFPWTRAYANRQFGYIIDPLESMGQRIVNEIPNLVFLVILYIVVKYLLAVVHLFFNAVDRGQVTFSGFDREWAQPTFTLLRFAVIALALVVAYPYIPGSGSAGFKGISVFVGIVFSLGSSSAIGNTIAGYMMTYRRAFRVGDRVKIGDTIGNVTKMRLQVTHVQTIKNEEVTVPNSTILASEVVNFSALARSLGLILHTSVNVGYGTPWRQVEALLVMAAERTTGLMRQPRLFILQRALENFAVTYELNAYCDNAQAMASLYTDLHRNILDLFNEYGVQIMTPAYEGDPEEPKVVPKDEWFKSPANGIREEGA